MLSRTERETLVESIHGSVNQYMMGADMKLCAFCAACQSPRRHAVGKPFVNAICSKEHSDGHLEKDYTLCNKILNSLPPIHELGNKESLHELSDKALQVLVWLLANDTMAVKLKPSFQEVVAQRSSALKAAMDLQPELRPHAILEVLHPPDTLAGATVKDGMVAFHGTALDCVHSILHAGLLSLSGTLMERTGSAFGSGIYLSLDPQTAFSFSQAGMGWKKSMFGPGLRCLLMCDVARDAVEVVKSEQARPGGLPQNYLLLKRADHVRVTHLLVYQQPVPVPRKLLGVDACTALMAGYVVFMFLCFAYSQGWHWRLYTWR